MRRFIFVAVLASFALSVAPAAQASDDSVRAVVRAQAQRQANEDARFGRALRNLDTRAGLNRARRAIGRQAASIKMFKAALLPERADTARVADGRRELLNALNVYARGLRNLQAGIKQALRPGGKSGVAKAKSAVRNMRNATRRAGRAARKIG